MHFDNDFAQIQTLKSLKKLIADSSSLIYLEKSGALKMVSEVLGLETIPEVIRETGNTILEIKISRIEELPASPPDYLNMSTDKKLVHQAEVRQLPVLSDDRRIMRALFEKGIACHTALEMFIVLCARGLIGYSGYENFRNRLEVVMKLKPELLRRADALAFVCEKYH